MARHETSGVTNSGNAWNYKGGRNEYGGQVVQVMFEHPPTYQDIDEVAHNFDSCPFGWRIVPVHQLKFGESYSFNKVSIKIHND